MCTAARNPNPRFLALAVKYGGDVNIRNTSVGKAHSSPIACAISKGNTVGVSSLLSYDLDVESLVCSDCQNKIRRSHILEFAIYSDQIHIALMLYNEVEFSDEAIAGMIRALEANNYINLEMQQYHTALKNQLEADGYTINLRERKPKKSYF